jgi:hypothetical protein
LQAAGRTYPLVSSSYATKAHVRADNDIDCWTSFLGDLEAGQRFGNGQSPAIGRLDAMFEGAGVLMTGAAMAQFSSWSSKSGQAAMSTPWFSGDASVHQWGACVPSARRPPASSAAATLASA